MVKIDFEKICAINLLLQGFGNISQSTSKRLAKIFSKAQNEWSSKTYDFGLRTLMSVIQLASRILKRLKSNQKKFVSNMEEKSVV